MVRNGAGPFISSSDKRILTLCLFSALHTCLSLVAAAQTSPLSLSRRGTSSRGLVLRRLTSAEQPFFPEAKEEAYFVTVTVVQESPDERVGNVGNEKGDFAELVVEHFVVGFPAHKTTRANAQATQYQWVLIVTCYLRPSQPSWVIISTAKRPVGKTSSALSSLKTYR